LDAIEVDVKLFAFAAFQQEHDCAAFAFAGWFAGHVGDGRPG
jgi:hypothetical protein